MAVIFPQQPQQEWRESLCGCFSDIGICCYGLFCPCCLYGDNAEQINGSSCCGQCCIYGLVTSCGLCCLVHMGNRRQLRQKYGIQEACSDCCVTMWCAECAMCQEARELKTRGPAVQHTVFVQPMSGPVFMPPHQYQQQHPVPGTYSVPHEPHQSVIPTIVPQPLTVPPPPYMNAQKT